MRVLILEFALLLRSRAVAGGLAVLLVAGTVAIWHGRDVIARQNGVLAGTELRQQEEHAAILRPAPADSLAGDQLYYLFFHTRREPSAWAPAFLGQRDVQPFNLKVRLLALQGQLYDAELGSPLLASFGNFDLAFVFVVLTPLLVIATTFNVMSGEREAGTWPLVRSLPVRSWRVLARRFGLAAALAVAALMFLLVAATLMLDLPVDRRWGVVAFGLVTYVAFWIAAAAGVNALGRSSEFNVLLLLGVWMVCTVIGPALINVAAATRFPLPEGLELTVAQREGYHGAWDRPLPETMAAFYARYPEWAPVPLPADRYSNGWYYAMQQRGDDQAAPIAARYRAALEARERFTARASMFVPPALLQRSLARLAATDLPAYLAYLDSVAEYHETLKRQFFPIVFSDRTIAEVDWRAAPRHQFRDH